MVSVVRSVIPSFGDLVFFSHLIYDTIFESLDSSLILIGFFESSEVIRKEMVSLFADSHIHAFEILEKQCCQPDLFVEISQSMRIIIEIVLFVAIFQDRNPSCRPCQRMVVIIFHEI